MSKKNAHIDKYLTDKLPEPEIPADEAWANMNGMLGPAAVSGAAGGKLLGGLKWASVVLTGVSITAILITKLVISPNSPDQPVRQKEQQAVESKIKSEEKLPSTISDTTYANQIAQENKSTGAIEIANNRTFGADQKQQQSDERADLQARQELAVNAGTDMHKIEIWATKSRPTNTSSRSSKQPEPTQTSGDNKPTSGNEKGGSRYSEKRPAGGETISYEPDASASETFSNAADHRNGATKLQISLSPIAGTKGNFAGSKPELGNKITVTTPVKSQKRAEKEPGSFHIGLEWNLNSPFAKTNYLFAGKDSVSKPANLLIPALVISRTWRAHQLTLTAAARQTYFGNNKTSMQVIDSTFGDSSLLYYNYNLIKATGIQLSLQYHYRFAPAFSVGAGVNYAVFSNALLRQTTTNWQNKVWDGPLAVPSGRSEVSKHVNPSQFALKAGLLFQPGRFQAGFNVILPVTNISRHAGSDIKELNGQLFFRFMFR
ncbi:hypothetical protein [Dyadobacter crusticola]|uniref:hypothetical protein n=1 Tax=Dyadobacter crusticola TaxID=292407 RepID=UPI0004E252A9|nr:hypothetical protein [Dyadobacter crusticola]